MADDGSTVQLPQYGSVAGCDGPTYWLVVDDAGDAIEPVRRYLVEFAACGNRGRAACAATPMTGCGGGAGCGCWTCRGIERRRPTCATTLWLGSATKPGAAARTASAATAGTVNPVTRKAYLDDRYQPRTIRHALAVLRGFYEYWAELGEGPVVNPVQRATRARPNAHHNPTEPFRAEGTVRYNPPIPKRRPRTLSDDQWRDVFTALLSHRDRALLALALSNGARAGELLGLRGVDIDWGTSSFA